VERIGPYAESLVHMFCTTKNRFEEFTGQYTANRSDFYRDLLAIEYCNLIEQGAVSEKAMKIQQMILSPE
jgi:hypothetical protein